MALQCYLQDTRDCNDICKTHMGLYSYLKDTNGIAKLFAKHKCNCKAIRKTQVELQSYLQDTKGGIAEPFAKYKRDCKVICKTQKMRLQVIVSGIS